MKTLFSSFFLFIIFLFFNYYLFSFEGIPSYRDFVGSEYFYNIENIWQIGTVIRYIVNFLSMHNIDIIFVYRAFFAIYFSFTFLFIYLGIQKFATLLFLKKSILQKIFLFCLSFFLVYNPWVFERVLMGQLGVILGYSLLFFNIGLLFELFEKWEKLDAYASVIAKNILYFSFSLLFSLFISPHYTIIILALLSIYFIHTLTNSLFYTIKIKKIFFQFISVVFPSLCFLILRYREEVQYSSFSQSLYQSQILENFSLWEDTPYFFITSLLGGNSWMSNGFIEKINISIDLGFLNILSLGFYPAIGVVLFAIIISIYFHVIYLYINKYALYKNKLLIFALFAFPVFLIFNFGLSGGLELINRYVYELPFSYIFRESGKFYALVLLSLSIILLAFWKMVMHEMQNKKNTIFFQENIVIILICFVFSSFLPFLYLGKNLNQPHYPQIYKDLQKDCSPDKKILFLPISQYSVHSYSSQIFMINPDQYLFSCSRLKHSFVYLGNENIEIGNDERYLGLKTSLINLSYIQKNKLLKNNNIVKNEIIQFLKILQRENVHYVIVDVTNKKENILILVENLLKYISIYKQEGNIFIFNIRK